MATHEFTNSQSVRQVANSILEKHRGSVAPSIEEAVADAVYLYELPSPMRAELDLSVLWFYDEQGQAAKGDDLYIHNPRSKYGPDLLHYPTLDVRFLSPKYTMDLSTGHNQPGFIRFLVRNTGLTNIIRINKGGRLSPEFNSILLWRPGLLIRILHEFWDKYQNDMNDCIRDEIANTWVLSFNRSGSAQFQTALSRKETCLIILSMEKETLSRCGATAISFLSFERGSGTFDELEFLSKFGVKFGVKVVDDDLDFYLWLGRQDQFRKSCKLEGAKRYLEKIANLIEGSSDKQLQTRASFQEHKLIYRPVTNINSLILSSWVSAEQCVWNGPAYFKKTVPLKPIYGDSDIISNLFRNTLCIGDTTVKQVINDLISEQALTTKLKEACEYIGAKVKESPETSRDELDLIRAAFRKNRLIPTLESGILLSSFSTSCFWGGPPIPLKENLEPYYKDNSDLRHLFHSILNIRSPNLTDLIDGLKKLTERENTTAKDIQPLYAYISNECSNSGATSIQDHETREAFENNTLVYTRGINKQVFWCKPSECSWDGKSFIATSSDIVYCYTPEDESVINFLRTTLGIKDNPLIRHIETLRLLRKSTIVGKYHVELLYQCIERDIGNQVLEIRAAFESESLIYDHLHAPPRWVFLRDCVWQGVESDLSCFCLFVNLALCYPSFEALFSKELCIKGATQTQILMDLLFLLKGQHHLATEYATTMINTLLRHLEALETFDDLEALWTEKLWPCKKKSPLSKLGKGTQVFSVSPRDHFFIPDHRYLQDLFEDTLPFLDLEVKQVLQLRSLFLKLGLEGRLLTKSVKRTTRASDHFRDTELTLEMRYRARALLLCGEHFDGASMGPRSSSLEKLFNTIEVHRAAEICITYRVELGISNEVVEALGLLCFNVEDKRIRIFVPEDEDGQKEAYTTCLPKEIISLMGLREGKSWQFVTALLSVKINRVKDVLDLFGVQHSLPNYSSGGSLGPGEGQTENTQLDSESGEQGTKAAISYNNEIAKKPGIRENDAHSLSNPSTLHTRPDPNPLHESDRKSAVDELGHSTTPTKLVTPSTPPKGLFNFRAGTSMTTELTTILQPGSLAYRPM